MFSTFSAWFLILLLLVPLLIGQRLRRRRRDAISFSSTASIDDLPRTWRERMRWLPPALGVLAVILMIVALARPQEGRKQTISDSEGIAIELVVDCSGSMQALDFDLDGQPVDRLTAIQDVAGKFVLGDGQLPGRFSDLIGLITFARFADTQNPPTLDHTYLAARLNQAEIVTDRNEDGTAIGDAIGLAIEKLNELKTNQRDANQENGNVKSKVIILLTDGENNSGDLDPLPAAELARTLGIRIYTIGVGTQGMAPVPVMDPYTGQRVLRRMPVKIDEDTLSQVADTTGGQYFRATDTRSLTEIYRQIDELEKTEVESRHLVDYRELAIEPLRIAGIWCPPLILLALICLAAQMLLGQTVFREFNQLG